MKMMPMPLSFSSRMTEKSSCTSFSSSEEVGSSRIRILALMSTARAMETICCTAVEYWESGRVTSMSRWKRSISSAARRLISRQLMEPCFMGWRPTKIFSATVRLGHRLISWNTVEMPSSIACCGLVGRISFPSSVMVPASILFTPVRHLISVDLPAPFSPKSA